MPFAESRKHAAPDLGMDTQSVLLEAGYTDDQIRAFKEEMVI